MCGRIYIQLVSFSKLNNTETSSMPQYLDYLKYLLNHLLTSFVILHLSSANRQYNENYVQTSYVIYADANQVFVQRRSLLI